MRALRLPASNPVRFLLRAQVPYVASVRSQEGETSFLGLVDCGADDLTAFRTEIAGSPRFLADPSCTFALFTDPGPVDHVFHDVVIDAAPASNKTKAQTMMISRLNGTASIPAVYASRAPLPTPMQDSLPSGW